MKHTMLERRAITPASAELALLREQTEQARTALAQLQNAQIEAENHLQHTKHLLEANEQLVISTLRAQTEAETANIALALVAQTAELDVIKRASQSKSEFLSRVSHELRTPLNAILGFGSLMLTDDDECSYLNQKQRERLEAIRLAGQQLLSLTNDLLDLARIEDGRINIDIQTVDVCELICSSETLLRPSALQNGIQVRILNDTEEHRVMADERALGQVLLNLISNAIKYNRPGGWVTVNTETQLGEIVITVKDNGLGMSSTQLAKLFQPFNRLGAELGTIPGSGLGLVISKALVELMGGTLLISSTKDEGTTVEIRLCKLTTPLSPLLHRLKATPLLPDAEPITTVRTVLYVEDNVVNATVMAHLFEAEPAWSLSIAPTGKMGIEMATSLRPNLIILDMQLPDMTGLHVFHILNERRLLPPKGCIALSADAMPEQAAAALAAGFSQYWTKPIDIRQTIEALRQILKADPD